jgi:bud site selection protein 31
LYYEKEAISKTLYDWLLKNNYADAMLIAKWKKQGYEKVSRRKMPKQTNHVD